MNKLPNIEEIDKLFSELINLPFCDWPLVDSRNRTMVRLLKFRNKPNVNRVSIGKKLHIIKLFGYTISFNK